MTRMLVSWRTAAILIAVVLVAVAGVFSYRALAPAPVSAAQLGELYFDHAFEEAVALGRAAIDKGDSEPALAAWLALNELRANRARDAIARATALRERAPDSPWSAFAMAGALQWDGDRADEALAMSAEAAAADPGRAEFQWLRAETLRLRHRFTEALAYLEETRRRFGDTYLLQCVEGALLFDQITADGDASEARAAEAMSHFAKAQEMAPESAMAPYMAGWNLSNTVGPDDALEHFRQAAELTPASKVHGFYWRAVSASPRLAQAREAELIKADLAPLLRRDSPQLLAAAFHVYQDMGLKDEAGAMADRLQRKYPRTLEAGQVEFARIMIDSTGQSQAELAPAFRRRLFAVARLPALQDTAIPADAYRILAAAPASAAEARRIADGLVRTASDDPRNYAAAAIALTDHAAGGAGAEALAREGLRRLPAFLIAHAEEVGEEGDDYLSSLLHDALGWSLAQQGKRDEAAAELSRAHTLAPRSLEVMRHLGKHAEMGRDFAAAERWYIKGAREPTLGANSCVDALRDLYARQHGGDAGFDDYYRRRAAEISRALQAHIAESRIANPQTVSFSLRSLGGPTVSSDDLRGKIVVASFWSLSCGPCLVELPEIERLSRDPAQRDVVFLTIFDGHNAEGARKWADEHAIALPILDGRAFMRASGVVGLPTTWFLDTEGRKVFEVTGYTPETESEFANRIDALRR